MHHCFNLQRYLTNRLSQVETGKQTQPNERPLIGWIRRVSPNLPGFSSISLPLSLSRQKLSLRFLRKTDTEAASLIYYCRITEYR